ncbi:unnamed protein product [Albugo candida]|uniref:Uncharacterized protein n=1 Tax=Albugo candida TaxID=65357 RepID=A0A024FUB2_9STRA|nr:unnamed protein product [Albugo candida]|eukprot:CCI10621.1 unnamed protein product [Albugo candida]
MEAVVPHLKTEDTDQEVKEAAIDAAGGREREILLVLSDVLTDENTRVHAMKAITSISQRIDISAIRNDVQIVLQRLPLVICSKGAELDQGLVDLTLAEACVLLNGSGFQLCRLAIELALVILKTTIINLEDTMFQNISENCIQLARNKIMQGECFNALERYFAQLTNYQYPFRTCYKQSLCADFSVTDRSYVIQSCLQKLDAAHDPSKEKHTVLALYYIG